ncbi:unnamed protein product [Mytilus coruscus]|uniref:Uncharacterized protein n=1 Tax=Mytilus coruscus TaxID=42192 RepID=A0A6J8CQK1_MYTCO|nr:unnamed protein product [Mytilus coruscus]
MSNTSTPSFTVNVPPKFPETQRRPPLLPLPDLPIIPDRIPFSVTSRISLQEYKSRSQPETTTENAYSGHPAMVEPNNHSCCTSTVTSSEIQTTEPNNQSGCKTTFTSSETQTSLTDLPPLVLPLIPETRPEVESLLRWLWFISLIKLTKFGNKRIEGPTGKRTFRPVILADSKGVRLQQQFIHKDQSNIIWWCKRGRKVHEAIDWLKTNLETEIQLIGDIWLYIWVGTCNLTSLDRSTRYICLSSSKSQETVDQITTTYKDIIQLFAKYPNCKLTFLETPFYLIVNWNTKQKHKDPSTFLEQDHLLEQQVILLNKEVKSINSSLGTHSPDFS